MKTRKVFLNWGLRSKPLTVNNKNQFFDELYWSKSSKIKKQVFFIVGPDLFEDATQEVFIKIYKNIHTFSGKSSLDTWVYKVTLNTCLNYLRKNKQRNNESDISDKKISSIETEGVDPFKRLMIQDAINTLNEKHKSVFTLFFIMEVTIKEIAEILQIKEGTVKSRIHNSKKEIKNYLEKKGVHFE